MITITKMNSSIIKKKGNISSLSHKKNNEKESDRKEGSWGRKSSVWNWENIVKECCKNRVLNKAINRKMNVVIESFFGSRFVLFFSAVWILDLIFTFFIFQLNSAFPLSGHRHMSVKMKLNKHSLKTVDKCSRKKQTQTLCKHRKLGFRSCFGKKHRYTIGKQENRKITQVIEWRTRWARGRI